MHQRTHEGYACRSAGEGEQGYVLTTWMASLKSTKGLRELARDSLAFREQIGGQIDKLLDRRDTRVAVCIETVRVSDGTIEHPIAGWICWTPILDAPVIHYVYVRSCNRHEGVAQRLMLHADINPKRPLAYTYRGPAHQSIIHLAPRALYLDPIDFLR